MPQLLSALRLRRCHTVMKNAVVADAGLGQRAARPPAARAGGGAVAVVVLVVHVSAGPHGGAGAPADLALRTCALGRHSWFPTHRRPFASAHSASLCGPPERMWTDGRRLWPPERRTRVHGVLATSFIRDGCGLPTPPFGSRGGARLTPGRPRCACRALRGQAAAAGSGSAAQSPGAVAPR